MTMKLIRNEKGIALVMVMIIALIGLAMVSTLLFMVTQGTRISGFQRVYRSTDEAGLGGAQIATEVIRSNIFNAVSDAALQPVITGTSFLTVNLEYGTGDACLKQKLKMSRGGWDTADPTFAWSDCVSKTDRVMKFDADVKPDFTFDLAGATGQTFRVYSKIIDTVKGNTEEGGLSGSKLGGTGVVSSQEGQITPPPTPTLYRIEIQAQDASHAEQRSRYSVLYAH